MAFDIEGARKAGYSDAEIADHLSSSVKFNTAEARKAGYSDAEILSHLASSQGTKNQGPSMRSHLKDEVMTSVPGGMARGVKDLIDTGAEYLARGVAGSAEGDRIKAMNDSGKAAFQAAKDRTGNNFGAEAGRIGGNVLGTLPVGGAIAAPLKAVAPSLSSAIASGGMSAAGAGMGVRMLGGGITGGASAALVNPEDAGKGAAIGAAAPPIVKGLAEGGKLAARAAKPIVAAVSDKAAKSVALDKAVSALGDDASQAIGNIQTHYPAMAESIPLSAAAVAKNPELARLEQASRLRQSPSWYEFDQKQGKALWENVQKATSEADELGARFAQRQQNWADNWAKVESNIKPRVFSQRMGDLYGDLQQAKASPAAVNPQVRGVLDQIENTVMGFGKDFSPAHLQQLRAEFNGKVQPMASSAIKSAPRDTPAIKTIIQELDDILNKSTGDKWNKVKEGYAKDTEAVHAAKAASKVREGFVAEGTVKGKSLDPSGDVPLVTEARLSRAITGAKKDDGTIALSELGKGRLDATLNAIQAQNIVQGVKRSGSAGGGSDTAGNFMALNSAAPTWLVELLRAGKSIGTAKTDKELAAMLQDGDTLASLLSARKAKGPGVNLADLLRAPARSAPLVSSDR